MYKNHLKKVLIVIICISLMGSISVINAFGMSPVDNGDVAVPMYKAISYTHTYLNYDSWCHLVCEGGTKVWGNNIAGITVELQQYYGGDWHTIKEWSWADGNIDAWINESYYVDSGYSYRLKNTHCAYNSNWVWVEDTVTYSQTITF